MHFWSKNKHLQLNHASRGKMELCYNVNVDWGLISDDYSYDDVDFSDDDIVDRCQVRAVVGLETCSLISTAACIHLYLVLMLLQTPDKLRSRGSRPNSLVVGSDLSLTSSMASLQRERLSGGGGLDGGHGGSLKSSTLPQGLLHSAAKKPGRTASLCQRRQS